MKFATLAAATAALALLSSCGSKGDDTVTTNTATTGKGVATTGGEKTPGPPVTEQSVAAANAYANSKEAKDALAGPAPQVAGVAKPALDNAAELAVCRIAFAVKHGEQARAPSDVELRQAAFDLASNPKALEECKARP
jgi:hypothetical protein